MLSLLLCALERVIFSSSKIFVAFVILIRSVIFNSGQKKKKMMTVANGGEEKQEHDVKKEPEEKDQAMMQVDPPPAAAPAPAVEVANATPPLAPPVPQQQQQQQQLPQRKMIPNPQDVNKAASIASERALIDAKKAISVRLKFKSKEGGKEDKKKDDFFRTAKDVLETLMPFHAFADQRGLFQFDPSFPSSLMVDDDEENKNKNARRKKLRLLREAVGMLIAEKEGFSTKEEEEKEKEEDKKDEGEERKANENNENEQKVKRRRLNEAYALLTEENVLRSGFAFRMNRVDDGLLKELRTLHKGLEVCEQSCARLQRHSDEDSTSANVLSKAEEFLIERLVSEETRIVLDAKSSELRKIAQEERQKMADVRKAETAFALASKAAAAAQQQQQIQLRFQQQQQQIQQQIQIQQQQTN